MFSKNMYSKLILLIVITILLAGCSKQPIKIGFMVDLTGRASSLGISGRSGAELAITEINQAGGINGRLLQLVIKDDKGLPEEAVKIDEELIQEGITLGVGHLTSGAGVAGLEIFNKANLLMISPTMSSDSLSGIDDLFFRVIASSKKQGELLAQAAVNTGNSKNIAIIYEYNNRAYSEEVCNSFKSIIGINGGNIALKESFISSPNTDFDAISKKVIESGAKSALIVAGGLDLGIIVQKIKKVKPDMVIYSGMWGMTDDAIKKGGKSVDGCFFAGVYDKNNQNKDFLTFRRTYIETYSEEPSFSSVYTFETIKMIAKTLRSTKDFNTSSIKEEIIRIKTFNGLQQDYSIDSFGDANRQYFLFEIQNSNFVRVD